MEPFLGEIKLVAFPFAPKGWAFCDGQLMSIQQNAALFSLLGTTFGGNGVQTFGLPDMRSRDIIGFGQGQGLSPYVMGEQVGSESVTLHESEMPSHIHALRVSATVATTADPTANQLAEAPLALGNVYGTTPNVVAPTFVAPGGGSQAHDNMQPFLVMNYVIALAGIYPSRP